MNLTGGSCSSGGSCSGTAMGTERFQATPGCQAFAQAGGCSKAAVSQHMVASWHTWLTNGSLQIASQAAVEREQAGNPKPAACFCWCTGNKRGRGVKGCNSGPRAPEWLGSRCSDRGEAGQRMEAEEPVGPQGQSGSAHSTAADGDATAASLLGTGGGTPGRQGQGASPASCSGFSSHTNKKMVFLHGSLIVSENEF